VYDEAARHGKPIFLAGNSLGTTAALYVASERPCAGLVLQNPPAIRNLILTRYGWWNLWLVAGPLSLQVPSELDGPTSAAKVKAPAVFILAEQDDFVVPANQRKVVDAFVGQKRVITTGGGHNDGVGRDAEAELQQGIDWLWEQAGLKKAAK
jgi:pimeloyl-ACP methyl ester carboxylesterase